MSPSADLGLILAQAVLVLTACVGLHVVWWRLDTPVTFHQWLPRLVLVFFAAGPAMTWWLAAGTHSADAAVAGHGAWLHLAAVLLLVLPFATVYVIGYTLISAFSPSIEILKLLRTSPGLRREQIDLPYLRTAVGGDRVANLLSEGLLRAEGDRVVLGPRGASMVKLALLYRHTIGLPDGSGG